MAGIRRRQRPSRTASTLLTRRRALLAGPTAILLLLAAAAGAAPHHLDYLYIDANEGGSAGGHAAIRFGDRTFHFQHTRGGLLTLERDPSPRFEYLYAKLGNRSLHVNRVPVSEDTYRALRGAFNRYRLVQREQLAALDAAAEDRELLASLRARAGGEATLGPRLRGAGLFDREPDAPGSGPATLRALARQIAETHGPDFAARRRDALYAAIQSDAPEGELPAPESFTRTAVPAFRYGFARRSADRLEGLVALEVLNAAPALHPDAVQRPTAAEFALDDDARESLRRTAESLGEDLVALVASSRPDWGFALLAGMARLSAIAASVESGTLVFLDGYAGADAGTGVPLARVGDEAARRALLASVEAEFATAREALAAERMREADYARLELAANHYFETREALAANRPIRLHRAARIPARGAHRPDLMRTDLTAAQLAAALDRTAGSERAIRARLDRLYGYDLLERNCVSEIFATIDAALAAYGEAPGESQRRLGGHVATSGNLNFIPFVSERAVRSSYRVSEHFEIPSHRRESVAAMRISEPGLLVSLRESNTLTSSVYRRNDGDSLFLFFTDDSVLPRPVFGAFNLAAALGETAVGLLALPFDRGRTLWLGAKGIAVSLPEFAFFNIRKGTHAWVEPEPPPEATLGTRALERDGDRSDS